MRNRFKEFNNGELELLLEALNDLHINLSTLDDDEQAMKEAGRDQMVGEISEVLESRNNVY